MKQEKNNNQKCIKSVCVEKSSFKLTRVLLNELYENAHNADQDPCLEILIPAEDGKYYKLSCTVEKVRL